ncbi:MAG: hypothetical protein ACYYKD_03765 [Rhodospirillales bacterium]
MPREHEIFGKPAGDAAKPAAAVAASAAVSPPETPPARADEEAYSPRCVVKLSQRDWETVLKAVDEPPCEPDERMQKGMRDYMDAVASGKIVVKRS